MAPDWITRSRTGIQWVVGGLLVLSGLALLGDGGLGIVGGLVWIGTGVVAIPRTRRVLFAAVADRSDLDPSSIGTGLLIIIVVAGVVVGGALTPTPPGDSTTTGTATPTPAPTSMALATVTTTAVPTAAASSATATLTATPAPSATSSGSPAYTVVVTEVVDGDTMEVRYVNGTTDTVRLLGVDAPAAHAPPRPVAFEVPDTERGRRWVSDRGEEARAFARARLANEDVRIVLDERADRRGPNGRLLAYVYYDGVTMLNRQLLAHGHARVSDSSFSRQDAFEVIEADARSVDVGVWGYSASAPTPTVTSTPT